ncbi:kinetochore protein Spc25 [Drosophila sulfurigaster albostrigata]|uniref:kinetochore protein Spc25 n=1 Tax=Drosophila sulfurigaster albostrigata TaxID=89887 RepID=UPI002D21B09A|nr:kinetochore protein Spc25 [Drosophila sulfurigaster albostrigata]XP_062125533.1 kinetochore protein Spc25 [Drosophila sulfurigaster albostrigata]
MAQQQFDINKRLMTMLKNEMRAGEQKNAHVKQTAKVNNNVASVKETLEQQKRAYEKVNAKTLKRRKDLEACEALIEAVQEQVTAAKQRNDAMRERLAEVRKEHNQYRGCVRVLCDATNILMNTSELPTKIKGVTVSGTGDQWLPFDVSTSDLKGLSMLGNRIQCNSLYADKWNQLLQVGNPDSGPQRNLNVTASSIVEIDLTSPQSQR